MALSPFFLAGFLVISVIFVRAENVEEDFAFDSELPPRIHGLGSRPVQRKWGVPDTTAFVGHLFRYRVPKEAFSGEVARYEARSKNGQPLPAWLLFKKATGFMEGVPTHKDIKDHYVQVRAFSPDGRNAAQDTFLINVVSDSDLDGAPIDGASETHGVIHHAKKRCSIDQGSTVVNILMDVRFDHMKPKQRVITIENLAGFLSLPYDIFKLEPDSTHDDLTGETVITAGEGNVKNKKWKQSTVLHWQVGCDGKIWPEQAKIVDLLKQQAVDGTLAEVLRWPVIGWFVKTEQSAYLMRDQATAGSGWPDAESEDIDSDVNELSNQVIPSLISRPIPVPSTSTIAPSIHVDEPHHHSVHHIRHHPEESLDSSSSLVESSFPSFVTASFNMPHSHLAMMSTPIQDPVRPTLIGNARDYAMTIEPTPSLPPGYEPSSLFIPSSSPEPETPDTDDYDIEEHGVSQLPSEISPLSTDEFESASNATFELTEPVSSSTPIAPTSPRDFSNRGMGSKNAPPMKQHRLRKLSVTAGKILREKIPDNTFVDSEDGDTSKLKLELKSMEGTDLNRTYWIQLDEDKREIIALPLDDHVSKWVFTLVASDMSGETANDSLEVSVQHHKHRRNVNHEFVIVGEPDDIMRDQKVVPWEIELVEGLSKFFGDKDSSQITVLRVNLTQLSTHGPIAFAWKNDSLPRDSCPEKEAQEIMKALTKDGEKPSEELVKSLGMLGGHLNITKITYKGLMYCETTTPRPSTPSAEVNNPPMLRNHVDHIPATVGQLLTFIVPEDTFYDVEDTSTRNMRLSLLTIDLLPISPQSWLQFDEKNQEFYGVPSPSDEGPHEYQLVCTDKGGKTVQDSLIVDVRLRPPAMDRYGVEFSMTLATDYSDLLNAALKRKFINKILDLFEDKNASSVILANTTVLHGATVIRWFNSSLPTNKCPDSEVRHLRQMVLENDGSLLPRVATIMSPEFTPTSIELQPAAVCQGELTPVHVTDPPPSPVEEPTPLGIGDEYLITFVVPAVIICVMLLLASVVACMLYRRRRTGKMTVGDEDERQSYRNKGIPVIFQDELEERPEPANKSPVIMKEEKPPLPPPEYQRNNPSPPPTAALLSDTEDAGPYQPPPPFTTSRDTGRQTRQKHTPSYRKPPAYVPP